MVNKHRPSWPGPCTDRWNRPSPNVSADTLIFDPEERQPGDDLKHAFEAATTRLDEESKNHLKATIEGLLLRTETRRWDNAS